MDNPGIGEKRERRREERGKGVSPTECTAGLAVMCSRRGVKAAGTKLLTDNRGHAVRTTMTTTATTTPAKEPAAIEHNAAPFVGITDALITCEKYGVLQIIASFCGKLNAQNREQEEEKCIHLPLSQ